MLSFSTAFHPEYDGQEKLMEDQTRQKSYADRHRRALELQRGKFEDSLIALVEGSYRLASTSQLYTSSTMCFMYHYISKVQVSSLFMFSLEIHSIWICEDLSYSEEPESILDRQDRVLEEQDDSFVKFCLGNHPREGSTLGRPRKGVYTDFFPYFLP
ncbi:hypothetical protein Tco_0786261 [Tanacetum coccineum]